MEFFKIRRTIPFMRHALLFNVISAVTFLAAVFFLAYRGLNFSVEFTGGTLIEVGYQRSADVERRPFAESHRDPEAGRQRRRAQARGIRRAAGRLRARQSRLRRAAGDCSR